MCIHAFAYNTYIYIYINVYIYIYQSFDACSYSVCVPSCSGQCVSDRSDEPTESFADMGCEALGVVAMAYTPKPKPDRPRISTSELGLISSTGSICDAGLSTLQLNTHSCRCASLAKLNLQSSLSHFLRQAFFE